MTTPVSPFRSSRWTADHISNRRADGSPLSLVERAVLLALGHLSGPENRGVTVDQLEVLTGLRADLILDVLSEAEEKFGEVRHSQKKFWPISSVAVDQVAA